MRTPGFWSKPLPDWRARLLSPLGHLYASATARRLAKGTPRKLSVPVICVGNINAGGTGKTPTVVAVAERLRDHFHDPHVVSRGYGGSEHGPVEVDPARHTAAQVGDEPLLLSAFSRTWVAKDRIAGAEAAIATGATAIILDDGFQDPALAHDLSIVVVDAETGFGNGLCIPAGPLREPVNAGLARADLLLSIGPPPAQDRFLTMPLPDNLPLVQGELRPLQTGMTWEQRRNASSFSPGSEIAREKEEEKKYCEWDFRTRCEKICLRAIISLPCNSYSRWNPGKVHSHSN